MKMSAFNSGGHSSRGTKRPHPTVLSGLSDSFEDKNNDYLCPVCFDLIEEAHMTKCGHTFCHKCIIRSLENSNRCPKCNYGIEGKEDIFPNFLLNELVSKHRQSQLGYKQVKLINKFGIAQNLSQVLSSKSENLNLAQVNWMLEILKQRKQHLEAESILNQSLLLKEFLELVHKMKTEKLEEIKNEIIIVADDIDKINEIFQRLSDRYQVLKMEPVEPENYNRNPAPESQKFNIDTCSKYVSLDIPTGSKDDVIDIKASTKLSSKRKFIYEHYEDLIECYFGIRKDCKSEKQSDDSKSLEKFGDTLAKLTKFNSVQPLATLNYSTDIFNVSNIVSSIEFDKDGEYFAIAGVTKRIKVFEYGAVIHDSVDIHYPSHEMLCNSKISCITWSNYYKGMLASSDYDGTVCVWDAFNGSKVNVFQEHEKRCWSVDFNYADTKLLASGSDDAKVKLWATNVGHSVACLEAKANVCCVKFNPENRYHLAYGSADHCVHYYDFRNPKEALGVFKGHHKAVSYVKFLNSTEMVSASTDSQLKLWDTNGTLSVRSFQGHLNEKNFVGLSTDGDYIACGSENNALYLYYKGLSKPLFCFKFAAVRSILDKEYKGDDSNEFLSAVCWKQNSNVIIAANSQGTIKILELI